MINIYSSGDSAMTVVLGNIISPEINAAVRAFCSALEPYCERCQLEIVPTYCGATVHYDPLLLTEDELRKILAEAADKANAATEANFDEVTVPVCYGGEYGPDLSDLAAFCGMTENQIIDIHSGGEYLIYMLGFMPGFPYMGGMDKRIAMPRLETPRTKIPWGSVGIAGEQTGIYPLESPGGWRLIGRTPLRLFDSKTGKAMLRAGMKLRFRPVTPDEYQRMAGGGGSD